jgi:hypothetical protein
LVVLFVVAVSVVSACGGATPEPAQPAPEEEPTAEPVEPTEEPAEAPIEAPTEAPTEEPTEEPVPTGAEALLQERCTECHALSQTTSSKKSRVGWEQTVTRMVKRGANLNEEEQAALIDYLAETYGQ